MKKTSLGIIILVLTSILVLNTTNHIQATPRGTATLNPSDDCWAGEGWNDSNFNHQDVVDIGMNAGPEYRFGYMKFNLASQPGPYTNATLRLYVSIATISGDMTFDVRNVTENWNETGITWNDRPTNSSTSYASPTFTSGSVSTWISIDITSLANVWHSDGNNGLLLAPRGTTAVLYSVYSKERSGYEPELILEGTNVSEIPAETTILFIFSLSLFLVVAVFYEKIISDFLFSFFLLS